MQDRSWVRFPAAAQFAPHRCLFNHAARRVPRPLSTTTIAGQSFAAPRFPSRLVPFSGFSCVGGGRLYEL